MVSSPQRPVCATQEGGENRKLQQHSPEERPHLPSRNKLRAKTPSCRPKCKVRSSLGTNCHNFGPSKRIRSRHDHSRVEAVSKGVGTLPAAEASKRPITGLVPRYHHLRPNRRDEAEAETEW